MENALKDWLKANDLIKYHQILIDNDIQTIDIVKTLNNDDLRELGISLGDRKRFEIAIQALETPTSSLTKEDELLLDKLPYVIAYPLKQTLLEKHPWTKINLLKDSLLNYLKYLALLSASEFFNSDIKNKAMVALFYQNLGETSFGKWNHYIREVLQFLKENNHTFFCPELAAYYHQVEISKKAATYKGEIEYIDNNGDIQLKKQEATGIGMLINFRNRYLGHGLTLDASAAENLWQTYFPIFRTLLEQLTFPDDYPMLKNEDDKTWLLHSPNLISIDKINANNENIWLQNKAGKYLNILPFYIVPGELAVSASENAKLFAYESFTGKTIQFFSPEGAIKQTSGRILEKLKLLLKDKQSETVYSTEAFTKELFLKRIEAENKILLDILINEKKVIPGVYQHREEIESNLRGWIGASANVFFIAAEAGSGKTNLLVEMQNQYTERGYPSLLVRAARMEKITLKAQIAYLLNIDPNIGLENYTAIAGTQAEPTFILIDGLNEASNALAIWDELLDWSERIEPGTIKFVVTSRANSKKDVERYPILDKHLGFLYGENKDNENGLSAYTTWLTPLDMNEMKGAWENYKKADKSRYKPLFTFEDIAIFDRSIYDQINNPLVLKLFLSIYNNKPLPKKGNKQLHIWKDWFAGFSEEEQTFLQLLANEVWLNGEQELLLDVLLKNKTLNPYLTTNVISAPYQRLKNAGWISSFIKDDAIYLAFTVEAALLYLMGKQLQQNEGIDLAYLVQVLDANNALQIAAIESFLCEDALNGKLSWVILLVDTTEYLDICTKPLLLFLKTYGIEATINNLLANPTANDWKVLLQLDDLMDELQLQLLRKEWLKALMPVNPLGQKESILLGLNAILTFDKADAIHYLSKINIDAEWIQKDDELLFQLGKCEDHFGNYDRALEYHEKSLAIDLKVHGGEHPDVAISYSNIGRIWDSKGDYDRAMEFHEKCLSIRLKVHGNEHPDVARTLNYIGQILESKVEYDRALEYHEKSLAIRLQVLGSNHPDVAKSKDYIEAIKKKQNETL
jgi:hypothetical protein